MIGILLANIGTPDAPDKKSVRRFLKNFLSDQRVISLPRWLWLPILYGFVLPFRPIQQSKYYQSIWTEHGSPLLDISRRQLESLKKMLPEYHVALGMRYSNPDIKHALDTLHQQGITKLILFPLYPQFSAASTASILDAVHAYYKNKYFIPEIRTLFSYYQDPTYIKLLTDSILNHPTKWDHLLFSFHGLPKAFIKKGDPYYEQCLATAKAVSSQLQLPSDSFSVAFQSRVGKQEWLKPYIEPHLKQLVSEGKRKIAVISPGFATDCLETLEEIAIRNRKVFLEAGGEHFSYVPALNDNPQHIEMLKYLIEKHSTEW
jgi:ferrochelatase